MTTAPDTPLLGPERDAITGFLDRLAGALVEADFDTYAASFLLPFILVTRETRIIRQTREEQRIGFDIWRRTLDAHGVTAITSPLQACERLGDVAFICDYRMELRRDGEMVLPPVINVAFLRQTETGLRCEQILSGMRHSGAQLFVKVDPEAPLPLIRATILDADGTYRDV